MKWKMANRKNISSVRFKKKTVGGLCLQMLSVFSCYSLQYEGREWDVATDK